MLPTRRQERSSPPRSVGNRRDAPRFGFSADRRKIERRAGSPLWRAVDRQTAAMALDQPVDDTKPEPGAAEFAGQSAIDLAEGRSESTRLNSSHSQISYAVFCLKKKKTQNNTDR